MKDRHPRHGLDHSTYIHLCGLELLERAEISRLAPRWKGKRPDLISIADDKTNSNVIQIDSNRLITRREARIINATVIEIRVIKWDTLIFFQWNSLHPA